MYSELISSFLQVFPQVLYIQGSSLTTLCKIENLTINLKTANPFYLAPFSFLWQHDFPVYCIMYLLWLLASHIGMKLAWKKKKEMSYKIIFVNVYLLLKITLAKTWNIGPVSVQFRSSKGRDQWQELLLWKYIVSFYFYIARQMWVQYDSIIT